MGENLLEKQSTIVKRSFRSSTKHLSLNSTIPIDEVTTKTFYHFKTSEFFNIWTPPFLHESQFITNQWCMVPSTWLTHQLEEDVDCKVFHFINNEDQEAFGYKTLRHKDAVVSFRENKASVTFCMYSPCILLCDGL